MSSSELQDQGSNEQQAAENEAEATPISAETEAEGEPAQDEAEGGQAEKADPSEAATREDTPAPDENAAVPKEDLPRPGHTAPHPGPGISAENTMYSVSGPNQGYTMGLGPKAMTDLAPPTINQLAIMASAQNKLPVNKCKGIVLRVGRHTESSLHKSGKWYKNHNYVDKDCYSWKNMPLFEDYQRHLWTTDGCVRQSFKK